MSEETVAAKAEQPEANAEGTPISRPMEAGPVGETAEEARARTVKWETHQRVLEESKNYKAKLQEIERKRLEEQGKWQEIAEKERAELANLRRQVTLGKIRETVSKYASEAHCRNVDDLLKLGNVDLIRYDEDTGEVYGAKEFVEAARSEKAYLFENRSQSVVNSIAPSGEPAKPVTDLKQMNRSQLDALFAEKIKGLNN